MSGVRPSGPGWPKSFACAAASKRETTSGWRSSCERHDQRECVSHLRETQHKDPVYTVFTAPMTANRGGKAVHISLKAEQVIAGLAGELQAHPSFRSNHPNHSQALPFAFWSPICRQWPGCSASLHCHRSFEGANGGLFAACVYGALEGGGESARHGAQLA
jgi:hypothetical protein